MIIVNQYMVIKLVLQFSINRIRMDLYQFSKYQNISDRLKRLANNQNSNKEKMSETLNPQTYRQTQNGNPIRKDNYSFEDQIKSKYSESSKYSNLPLQKKPSQEYGYRAKEATMQSQSAQQRLRKSINSRLYQKRIDKPQENKYQQKQAEEKQQYGGNKKMLQKVRSQGTIKIEEILESFNNYKQNKEKFISTLGKRQTAQTEYVEQQFQRARETKQQIPQGKKTVFKPIDNIWNQNHEDNHPKFKRSMKNVKDGYDELDIFNTIREPQVQTKPKNFSKSKLIQRNITTTYQPQVSQNNALKTLMSPRSRIPGKICKNRDRLLTNENY